MDIITFLNEKGGVGKTTCALHTAAGMAINGKRVLVIDADPQVNLTEQLRMKAGPGLMELLVDEAEWQELLKPADRGAWCGSAYQDKGELLVLPGHIKTGVIANLTDDITLLKERLEELRYVVDAVVIDTPPTPSLLHSMVYLATDYIVYPTQVDMMALSGLKKSLGHMQRSNKQRMLVGYDEIKLLGVQPTMYDVRTNAHDLGMSFVAKQFKNKLWPALAMRTKWRDAAFTLQTLFAHSPGCEAEVEAWAMVQRIERGVA